MIEQSVIVAATLVSVGVSYGRLSAQLRALTHIQNKQSKVISEVRDQVLDMHSKLKNCPLSGDAKCLIHENPALQLPTNGEHP